MSAAVEEQYFPRGKLSVTNSQEKTRPVKRKREKDEDLFKVISATKKSKSKKKTKKAKEDEDETMEEIVVEPLTQKTIQTGMVILGAVHCIFETELRIAVPGCIVDLPLANTSVSYNNLLQKVSAQSAPKKKTMADAQDLEKCVKLDELFTVGQLLKCSVQTTIVDSAPIVSTIPEDVNGGHSVDTLKNGQILQAAVSSVEDYGYGLELGIDGLNGAFISSKQVDKVMYVGQLLLVRVSKSASGKLQFSPYNFEEIDTSQEWNLQTITPGIILEAQVIQSDENGVGLWMTNGSLTGAVEPRFIPRDMEFGIQDKVNVVVLYTHPILNTVYCSMRVPLLDPQDPFAHFHGIKIGQIQAKCIVIDVKSTFVTMEIPIKKIKKSVIAICTRDNISDEANKDPSDLFTPGQVVASRVIGMQLLEHQLYVSLKKSVVEDGNYYTEDDIEVGKVFPAKVKNTNDCGIIVQLCPGIMAFCDYTEASFAVNQKNAAEMYPVGKPVKCRVRFINGKHYPKRYFVTLNKQIVKSKMEMISEYSTENIGKITEGIVLLTKPKGLLVGFFNRCKAWIPEEHLPASPSPANEIYRVGQVITVKILKVNEAANRMIASLNIREGNDFEKQFADEVDAESTSKMKNGKVKKGNVEDDNDFATGITGTVTKKEKHVLEVKTEEFGKCLLSVDHLTDFSDLSKLTMESIKVGSVLENLTVFSKTEKSVMLSMKPYVACMAASGQLCNPAKGKIVAASVGTHSSFGYALQLPNGRNGKLMWRDITDSFIAKDESILRRGNTVVCKIMNEQEPMVCSCKMSDVNYTPDAAYKQSLQTSLTKLFELNDEAIIGQVIKVVPQKIDYNIICDYKGKRAVGCATLTTDGQSVKSEPTNAIVLGVRYGGDGMKEYVVTLDREIVYKYIQTKFKAKKTMTQMPKGKVEVLVLAVLKDYAACFTKDGRLLFITLGNHFNDVRKSQWTLDRETDRLPRVVEAFVYGAVNGAIAVGNFCKAEGLSTVDVHTLKSLGEEVEKIEKDSSDDSEEEEEMMIGDDDDEEEEEEEDDENDFDSDESADSDDMESIENDDSDDE